MRNYNYYRKITLKHYMLIKIFNNKKEEFKTKICGCQYFVVVLLCYNRIFQIELVLINGLKNTLTKNGGDIQI